MNKHLRFIIFLLFAIAFGPRTASAQAAFASEEDLKQQAAKLFDDDSFEEAYPLYSQLVSLYPKDPNYNYRLGVCMLFASDDKEKPIPFLEFASRSPEVDKEVIFYLARAYHLNYRFDDAITQYMNYEKVASSAKAEKLQVEHQIEMCRNGKKLLRNITDLVVIEKKELSRADFYRAYDISDIGGKLLAKPDEAAFKTSVDKKKKEKSIIYLASNNNQVYFSSYGDDPSHGKDIYVIRKLPNGEWSKPQTLGYPVNTEYDEDFPFLHPNGKVLYFCSKGHNSMGGYDIFKSTLNEETNTWNKPVNLDFPINTPDDDILYVTNEDEKEAYFSSARNSKTGKTAVYHINVERKPIDIAIIKGAVMRNREGQAIDVKITVKDLADNMILGIYTSKAETGGYLINLPNGGKFLYTVEAAGFATQSEVVVLPTQYEFKPLKQEISYEMGTDKLIVKNMFDEPVDDQSYLQVLSVIKEKARMDAGITNDNPVAVNKTPATTEDTTTPTTTNTAAQVSDYGTRTVDHQGAGDVVNPDKTGHTGDGSKTTKGAAQTTTSQPANLSNNDIVKIAYADAKDAEKEAKDLQEQADIALNIANQKNELAQNKTQEATQLMSDANNMTDNAKKQTAIDDANQARAEEEELNQETVAAFNIAKKLGLKASAKAEEADLSLQYAKDLEVAVKSKNSAEAMAKLEAQEKKLEALSEQNGNAEPDNITAGLKMDADAKKRELDKATQASADIKQEMQDNQTLINNLQGDLEKTKKEDLKKGIEDQIAGLKADNQESQKDLDASEQKVAKLQKEYNGIRNEMELVSNVVDKSKTGTGEEAAASVKTIDKTKLEAQVNEMKVNTVTSEEARGKSKEGTVSSQESGVKSQEEIATNQASTAVSNTSSDYATQYTNELAGTASIANEAERENKKAQVYQSWVTSISNDLAKTKQAAKNEKNADKKKALNASIAAMEKDLKEKQDLQAATAANAKALEQQSTVAITPENTTTTPNNTTATTDAGTPANTTAGTNSVLSIDAVNATYAPQLADANKITNDLERENAKADVLKNWSDAINTVITKEKQEMAAATDPGVKADLANKIVSAQQLSEEKQTQASASLAQAYALKQQQAVAAGTVQSGSDPEGSLQESRIKNQEGSNAEQGSVQAGTINPQSASGQQLTTNNSQLSTALADADKAATEQEKVAKQETAYKMFIAAKNEDLKTKQAALKSEKDKNKKKELTQAIESIQNDIKEKQQLLDAATAKAEALANQSTATPDNATAANENPDNTTAGTTTQPAIVYNDAAAGAIAQKAAIAKKESDDFQAKANSLREQAATATPADKQRLSAQAAMLEMDVDMKKRQAIDYSSDANVAEYKANQNAADQYAAASAGSKADEVSMAEMLKDESKTYFGRAEKSMEVAETATSAGDKAAAMEAAVSNQQIALQKQQKALELYKKNNPGLVIKPTAGNTVATNTTPASPDNTATGTTARSTSAGTVTDGGTATTATTPENTASALTIDAVNAIYAPKLADANKITDDLERENAKAEVLKNWSDAINTVIVKEKQDMKAATDPSVKADLANKIVNAQQLSEEKQTQATASIAQADALKAQKNGGSSGRETEPATSDSGIATNETTQTQGTNETTPATTNTTADPTLKSTTTDATTATNATPANTSTPTSTESVTNVLIIEKVNETYAPQLAAANKITNEQERENAKAEVLKNWSDAINTVIAKEKSDMKAATDPSVKADLANRIVAAQKLSEEKQTQATASLTQANALKMAQDGSRGGREAQSPTTDNGSASGNEATQNATGSTSATNSTTTPTGDNTTQGVTRSTPATTETATNTFPVTNTAPTSDNQHLTSTLTAGEKFERTSAPVYSSSQPIPVNEKLPEGLVFKVQIGAFRNPISPDKFSGMKPITAETTAQGVTRYTAGLFTKFATADQVKTEIRGLGYKDAFVVAFLNGKRISMAEALKMTGESGGTAGVAATTTNPSTTESATTQASAPATTTTTNPVATATQQPVRTAVNPTDVAPSENVETVTGLFYTVQVGVYSQPITAAKLHNIQPLYTEKTPGGALRYNTGIYNSVANAIQAKNAAVALGIKDAFVTAYFKGKRISMAEAQTLEASSGSAVFSTAPGMNELPKNSRESGAKSQGGGNNGQQESGQDRNRREENRQPAPVTTPTHAEPAVTNTQTETPANTSETPQVNTELKNTVAQNNTMPVDPGVVFKVQIGAFKDEVPLDIANQFLKIANKGIKNYKDESGLTIYTVGNFKTYDEASQLRTEIGEVIKDAFIVAYNDGQKISLDEAKTLINK